MPRFDSEMHVSKSENFVTEVPIMIYQDEQDAAGYRVLYVLGFGIAGAISANAVIFAYFALFYTSG